MSSFQIKPSKLKGALTLPPSKSHTLRALVFALLAKGKSRIHNYLNSPDTHAMLHTIQALGAKVKKHPSFLEIEGTGGHFTPPSDVLNAKNSGLVLRLIGAISAHIPSFTVITGDHSIRTRRIVQPLLQALNQLGAFAESLKGDGHAPILIKGPIHPGTAILQGEDSQPVSALLISCSLLPGKSTLTILNPQEKPWIDLTLYWLRQFNIPIHHENYCHFTIPGSSTFEGFEKTIPGDFSSAAYPLAGAILTQSELTLHGVDMEDPQGDKQFIAILRQMGASIEYDADKKTLTTKKSGPLKGIQVDINDCIDMISILAVVACFAEGTTEISNAKMARYKETDRLQAIAFELQKMGAKIEEKEEGLIITPSRLKGASLNSYQDHRQALSLSIAALSASSQSELKNVECIKKTYPHFLEEFQRLGASIQ